MVAQKLKEVQNQIAAVCSRCGRKPEEVLLVAVSKTFAIEAVREAFKSGQADFGENYVRELDSKYKELGAEGLRWHFIGHLQSNKVKYIARYIHLVHSVDNERVAQEIDRRAEQANRSVDILVEVHLTDEATKFGVLPAQTVDLIKRVSRLPRVNILGLMTMGPFADDPNASRPAFRELADLRKRIETEGIDRVSMRHLSMGMSHDFEVAIEEGATIVRIGTAIFGKRTKAPNEYTEGAL